MQNISFQGTNPQITSQSVKRPQFSGSPKTTAPGLAQGLHATDSTRFSGKSDSISETEHKDRSFLNKSKDGFKQGMKDAAFSGYGLKHMGKDLAWGTAAAGVFFLFMHVASAILIPITMTLGAMYRFANGFYDGFKGKQSHQEA